MVRDIQLGAVAVALLSAFHPSIAAPAPSPTKPDYAELEQRGLISGILNTVNSVVDDAAAVVSPSATILNALKSVTPTTTQTDITKASAALSSIWCASPTPTNLFAGVAQLVAADLTTDDATSILDFVEGALDGENSMLNINLKNPSPAVYPKASKSDAPYDLTEAQLREIIHIPSSFKYGAKGAPQPIILVPGTGDTGYTTFEGNLIPLLQGSTIADPVWLNIPGYLLNDAQSNAEYVAYAINYIYGISNKRKIAVAAWSQGNLNTQWAFKYWPSTQGKVTDFISFSPDFHGTTLANLIDDGEPLPPSVLQQDYNSNFISKLRSNGGDSAYVPTTTIYSGFFDEIVEPQQGTGASGFINDARSVGVSNSEVQTVCAGQLAGTFYPHEGTLYNPLGFALLKDALANSGPGKTSRLNLGSVCNNYLTPGLDLGDYLVTENSLLIAAIAILTYPTPTLIEPTIKSYATY